MRWATARKTVAAPRVAAGDGATSDERLNDSCQLSPSPTCLRADWYWSGTLGVWSDRRSKFTHRTHPLWWKLVADRPSPRVKSTARTVSGETIQNVRALDTSALHAHPLTHSHMRTRSRPACIVQTHSQAQSKHVSKLGPCTLDDTSASQTEKCALSTSYLPPPW